MCSYMLRRLRACHDKRWTATRAPQWAPCVCARVPAGRPRHVSGRPAPGPALYHGACRGTAASGATLLFFIA